MLWRKHQRGVVVVCKSSKQHHGYKHDIAHLGLIFSTFSWPRIHNQQKENMRMALGGVFFHLSSRCLPYGPLCLGLVSPAPFKVSKRYFYCVAHLNRLSSWGWDKLFSEELASSDVNTQFRQMNPASTLFLISSIKLQSWCRGRERGEKKLFLQILNVWYCRKGLPSSGCHTWLSIHFFTHQNHPWCISSGRRLWSLSAAMPLAQAQAKTPTKDSWRSRERDSSWFLALKQHVLSPFMQALLPSLACSYKNLFCY